MSDIATAILDAAEAHIRKGGYGAFSFRELAAEVGVKSSSVHYHFPTKERLAAAVLDRYTERVSAFIDELSAKYSDPVQVMTEAFRDTVHSKDRLCPCLVTGAAIFDLPPEVSERVKAYYKMWYGKLADIGVEKDRATFMLSTLLGGQLLAAVEDNVKSYDVAAAELIEEFGAAA